MSRGLGGMGLVLAWSGCAQVDRPWLTQTHQRVLDDCEEGCERWWSCDYLFDAELSRP